MICFIAIGTQETFEALSRQISMKHHRDFFKIIKGLFMICLFFKLERQKKCFAVNKMENDLLLTLLNKLKLTT